MPIILLWLRYLLIVLPAAATSLLSPHKFPEIAYTLSVLALLLLVQLQTKWSPPRFHPLLLMLEAVCITGLYEHYQGILFFCFCSLLIPLIQPNVQKTLPPITVLFIAMNVVAEQSSTSIRITANITLITVAVMLFLLKQAFVRKSEIEKIYDELRKKHYDLEEARKQMHEYARRIESLAQSEERNRISRDIHDDLGHKLIRIKMMSEAAIHIHPAQPDKSFDYLRQIRDQLTEGMDILRSTVRKLKPETDSERHYSLDVFVASLRATEQLEVHFEVAGFPYALYPTEEIALYRNAQEAVTNAIRHGEATEIHITVDYDPRHIVMQVSNNGKLPADLSRKGLGISGMEERVRLFGGKVIVDTAEKFKVTTVLPRYSKAE